MHPITAIAIPAGLILVGIGLFWLAWKQWCRSRRRLVESHVVRGTVVGYDDKIAPDIRHPVYFPIVEFPLIQGGSHVFTAPAGSTKMSYDIGATVPVLYDLKAPDQAVIKSFASLYMTTVMLLVMGLGFSFLGSIIVLLNLYAR